MTRRVSSSDALTSAFLTFSCTGASLVAIKRVPMFMPAAPIASAATRLRASAMPPDATNGIFNSSAARGSRIMLGMSSSPGWPPHSKPSTLTASQPICSAFSECRTDVHLWITLMPPAFKRRHVLLGAATRGFDDLDAAFPDGCDVFRIGRRAEGRQEGQVHAERLVRHVAATRDLLGQQFRRPLRQAGDDSEPAGIRHCGREFGKAHIVHSALDDRMFDAEHLGNCCLHACLRCGFTDVLAGLLFVSGRFREVLQRPCRRRRTW